MTNNKQIGGLTSSGTKKNGLIVKQIDGDSIAEECEIHAGDVLLSINGHTLRDYIDYIYELAEEDILLVVQKKDGTLEEIEIEKNPYEELGITFVEDGFDKKIVCKNKCVFCFVDQLPKQMRKTLYFKDDDWRMSFLMGSYVTLTNLSEEEIARIIKQKISPLYVSVHAYDDEVRKLLLGTRGAEETFQTIRRFVENDIQLHTQIVMCEGLNDGAILKETIEKLYDLYPGIQSVSIVPVGVTKYRSRCHPLSPISEETAKQTIQVVEQYQREFLKKNGTTRFVFASDEMYIRAKLDMPAYETYEDFVQIENGVGLVETFRCGLEDALEDFSDKQLRYKKIGLITGMDFYPFLKKAAQKIQDTFDIAINVYCVENDFFGETVTVTGLLTGADVMRQVKPDSEEALFLSRCCFKEDEDIMLDDVSMDELVKHFKIPCYKADSDGYGLIQMLL